MKTFIKLNFLVIVMGLFSACTFMSPHMSVVKNNETLKPDAGKSLLVFLRPSSFGGAIQATIFDGTNYIGTVSANTKVAYQVKPGKHMFMVIGESADFMSADLMEGKTYYAQVAARMGIWKARFSFVPLNGQISDEKLSSWLKATALTQPNEKGMVWAKGNQGSIKQKHDSYLIRWNNKSDAKKQILYKRSGK